jgi:hypothetical protein
VLFIGFIEIGESPIDQPEFMLLGVEHHVKGFDVPVHYSLAVRILNGLKRELINWLSFRVT